MLSKIKIFLCSQTKKEYNRFIKASLFLMIFLITAFCVGATDQLESGKIWSNYQDDESLDGFYYSADGNWDTTNSQYTMSTAYGNTFQPLSIFDPIVSVDEIVIMDSSLLKIIRHTSTGLTSPYELLLTSTQVQQGAIANASKGLHIIMPLSNSILADVLFNASGLFLVNTENISAVNTSASFTSGVVCSSQPANDSCYFLGNTRWFRYVPQTKELTDWNAKAGTEIASASGIRTPVFPVQDWDFDGNLEVAYTTYASAYCQQIEVLDLVTKTVDAKTSTNPTICSGTTYTGRVGQLMFAQADNGGYMEVIGNSDCTSGSAGCTCRMFRVNVAGGIDFYTMQTITGACQMYGMAIGTFTSKVSNTAQACSSWTSNVGTPNDLICIDTNNMSLAFGVDTPTWHHSNNQIVSADMNDDGYTDLINPYEVYDIHNNQKINLTSGGGKVMVSDINDDGFTDVITQTTDLTTFRYFQSTTAGTGTQWIGVDVGVSFKNPVCVGQNISFYAYECGLVAGYSGLGLGACSYEDTYSNRQERLVTDCGGFVANHYGAYSDNNPKVTCNATVEGNYVYKIYLQDTSMGLNSDFTQVKTVLVQVRSKDTDSSCGQRATTKEILGVNDTTPTTPTSTEQDIKDIFDVLTFSSTWIKLVIVIACIGLTIYGLVKINVQNPIIYVISVIIVMVFTAMLGLLDWIYIMLVGFLISLVSAISWFKGGGGG